MYNGPVKGLYVEHLSWPEAAEALVRFPVVLLPLGARLKEHGRHLPLNNDWLLAEHLARRVAERAGVLVLPTLAHGHYPAFVGYPGSVSLSQETFVAVVTELCGSYARHGARRFYVLNTGISTLRGLTVAAQRLAAQGVLLRSMDLRVAWAAVHDQLVTQAAGSHADEIETSMMLHLVPEVVRMERAEPDVHPPRAPGPFTRDPEAARGVYSPTGAYGDPTLATADKGKRLVEAIVRHVVDAVEALALETTPVAQPSSVE